MKRFIKKIHHINEEQIEVINRGINLDDLKVSLSKNELRNKLKISNDKFILLSVGRHVPRKRFDLVLKAINKLKAIHLELNIKYFLIGKGPQTPYLKKLTMDLGLKNEVEFVGLCKNEKKNEFYKLSDVFVMPVHTDKTHIEGFGIVFLEANYYKLPVIGTSTGGVSEAIIDGETGKFVKIDDIDDLAE